MKSNKETYNVHLIIKYSQLMPPTTIYLSWDPSSIRIYIKLASFCAVSWYFAKSGRRMRIGNIQAQPTTAHDPPSTSKQQHAVLSCDQSAQMGLGGRIHALCYVDANHSNLRSTAWQATWSSKGKTSAANGCCCCQAVNGWVTLMCSRGQLRINSSRVWAAETHNALGTNVALGASNTPATSDCTLSTQEMAQSIHIPTINHNIKSVPWNHSAPKACWQ